MSISVIAHISFATIAIHGRAHVYASAVAGIRIKTDPEAVINLNMIQHFTFGTLLGNV